MTDPDDFSSTAEQHIIVSEERLLAPPPPSEPSRTPGEERVIEVSLPLPEDAPPTYVGKHAEIRYELSAIIEVVGTVDVVRTEPIRVWGAEPPLPDRRRQSALVDVALPEWTVPGAALRGTVVLREGSPHVRMVTVELAHVERGKAHGQMQSSYVSLGQVPLAWDRTGGGEIPFVLHVPRRLAAPYVGVLSEAGYVVRVHADVRLGIDARLEVPIHVRVPYRPGR